MKFNQLVILFLLIISVTLNASDKNSIRFFGKAPAYSDSEIIFNKISNFIISEASQVAVMQIDKDGNFDFSFTIDEITYIFAELGRYKTYIYVEPGVTYNLVFPPFEPKTELEKLNPHFQYEEIPFGIKNKESQALNRNIIEFNDEFEYLYSTNAVQIFTYGKSELVQEIESSLEERFTFSHPYFVKYKQLSYLKLQKLSQRMKERYFLGKFSVFELDYNTPLYWEVLKSIISGFLPQNFSGTSEISLTFAINSKMPFDSVVSILTTDEVFQNHKFAEISLLITLFESFYNKTINKSVCVDVTKSAISTASTAQNREIAEMLYKKMVMLSVGSLAPEFELYNQNDELRKLNDYSGKFIYLCFVHTRNHASILDIQTIEMFEKIYNEDLAIVTIVIDDEPDVMTEFLKKNPQYTWDFLHFGGQKEVLDNYNVKAVPVYYLIDPKGNISLSPAPSPRENFQILFVNKFNQYRQEELRINPPKKKSIFD